LEEDIAMQRFNLQTIGIFLLTRWLGVFLVVIIDLAAIEFFEDVFAPEQPTFAQMERGVDTAEITDDSRIPKGSPNGTMSSLRYEVGKILYRAAIL